MRCVASWSGVIPPAARADLVDQRQADGVLRRDQLDQPPAALVAGGQRLGEQVLQQEDLDPALAHPGHELVVLVLRPLDPQHVVEQQLVVVGRREPLQAQLRAGGPSPCAAGRPPSGLRTCHRSSFRLLRRRPLGCRPLRRRSARSRSSEPIAARPPVASTNRQAASTFGPIEPAGKSAARSSCGRHPVEAPLLRRPPVGVHGVDVGRHHEQVGVAPRGRAARWRGPCR